jgi:glutaredoxin
MQQVTLFSLSTCAVCKKVKKFLDDHGIPYTAIGVETPGQTERRRRRRE